MSTDVGSAGSEGAGAVAGPKPAVAEAKGKGDRRSVGGGGILARVGHLSGGGPPVSLEQVGYGTATTALFYHLLARYHYLGYPYPVGAKVRYLARGLSGLRRL